MSLRRLLTWLIGMCTGPLILLVVYLSISNVMTKHAERDIEAANLVKNFAAAVDQQLQARISALHMLAASPLVDDSSRWKDLYREAEGFYQGFGSHVILADPEMHMLFNTRVPFGDKLPMLPRPKGHAAAPTVLETGKPAVGDVFFGPIAKEPLVAIAVPAQRKGQTAFLLLTIFETHQFQKHLDQTVLPSRWSLALLDGKNEEIARRTPTDMNFTRDVDASNRFIAKSAVSPWSVVLEIPPDIYSKELIQTATALAIAVLSVILMSLLGGVLVSRRLRKAVASLAETPVDGASPPDIVEVATVRHILDESTEKRKRSETELQESEERYRSFFDNSIDAVLLTSPDGGILKANQEACRIFGYTEEEICGLGTAGVTDPTDPRLAPALEQRERTGHFRGELRCVRKDGTHFPVEISSAIFTDRRGNRRTSMIIRDIAERKRREKEIQLKNELLHMTGEMAKVGGWEFDTNTGKGTWTNEVARIHDMDPKLETNVEVGIGFYSDESQEKIKQAIQEAIDKAVSYDLELEMVSAAGKKKWIRTMGMPIMERGRVIKIRGIFQDITERKQKDVALQESEEKYRLIADNMDDWIYWVGEDGNFRYVSPSCERVSGYSVAEFTKNRRLMIEIAHPEDREILIRHSKTGMEEETDHLEFRIITKVGGLIWISHSCGPIYTSGGRYAGRRGTNRNITERKRAEEELRIYREHLEELVKVRTNELGQANLRLQELDRLKSMFIASMSHELRTPLNSIIGFTGIILMGMSGEINEVQKKQLRMVSRSANHLLELINDVIDVSKIEAGKTDLNIEAFDLSELTHEVKESFAVATSNKGLTLELPTEGTIRVTSDRRRIKQILVNLVGNAVKFTEKGTVAISLAESETGMQVRVRDTGVGMDKQDMERLFRAFSRIHIQRNPAVEGTGLGLYLSRRIAELLGGEITAESEPDRGSEFTLSLPHKYPGASHEENIGR